ncbi:integral membrane protein [Colletotrichum nymphaeae SA-01]|uniref:Integral membrane protein n=1 Tax=Colletotrichum nymphaeae SA-01 TaxID=1460502 RepID=A0A135STE0_9PEZI|nr:integral membrane protein [Colletotrichum nymphaeae SA-01]
MASDQVRQNSLIITACFFTAISTMVVIARTFVRAVLIRKPGLDDYSMIIGMVFTLAYLAEIFVGKANHIGFPSKDLSLDNMTNLLKNTLAIQVTYYVCISAIKISILCMYLRFVTSGFNIVTDIWILVLPIKTLMGILRPRREKIALGIIFGVGVLATITSIVRLHTIYTYTLAKDLFQESILINIWSMLEINIGIICASVPALKPLFTPRALREAANRNKPGGQKTLTTWIEWVGR